MVYWYCFTHVVRPLRGLGQPMSQKIQQPEIATALGRIPSGTFVLTSRHEDRRCGMLASWVQQVSFKPPMISIAVFKGWPIIALISESRHFGICQLRDDDKVIMHKFAGVPDPDDDPFLGFEMKRDTATDVPILANVLSYLECELTCHVDVDADHELFVGVIRGAGVSTGQPYIRLRDSGFTY